VSGLGEGRGRLQDGGVHRSDGDVAYHTSWGLETEILIVWGAQDRSHNPAGAEIRHSHLRPSSCLLSLMPVLEQPEGC